MKYCLWGRADKGGRGGGKEGGKGRVEVQHKPNRDTQTMQRLPRHTNHAAPLSFSFSSLLLLSYVTHFMTLGGGKAPAAAHNRSSPPSAPPTALERSTSSKYEYAKTENTNPPKRRRPDSKGMVVAGVMLLCGNVGVWSVGLREARRNGGKGEWPGCLLGPAATSGRSENRQTLRATGLW